MRRTIAAGASVTIALLVVTMSTAQAPSGYEVRWTSADDEALMEGRAEAWAPAETIRWGAEPYPTAFRALWRDAALFLRWDATDDRPWSTMTRRDDRIWNEEVVEIFMDLDHSGTHYAELEISPANVVCDVRMVRATPDRVMDLDWNFDAIDTRVHAAPAGERPGWVAVARIDWASFASLPSAAGVALPPSGGDRWRFNVYRIKRPHGPAEPERDAIFAAWSDTGEPSFHVPAAFRDFVFVGRSGG